MWEWEAIATAVLCGFRMSSLINLQSAEGQKLLNDCQNGTSGSLLQPYIRAVFSKQVGTYNCGIQSSAIVLAAQQLGKTTSLTSSKSLAPIPKDQQPITEETMFDFEATRNAVTMDDIAKNGGCTLEQMSNVLKNHGKAVKTVFGSNADVETFRSNALHSLSSVNSTSSVIVNYHMGTLGHSPPFGHHSPLAGYHTETDQFLVMDTGVNPEYWVKADLLFTAMIVVDKCSGKTRGYCIVGMV